MIGGEFDVVKFGWVGWGPVQGLRGEEEIEGPGLLGLGLGGPRR